MNISMFVKNGETRSRRDATLPNGELGVIVDQPQTPNCKLQTVISCAAVLLACALQVCAGELELACEALRDGLWDVARIHAAHTNDAMAHCVAAESLALEGDWNGLLEFVSGWGAPDSSSSAAQTDESADAYSFYRALALSQTGKKKDAAKLLANAKFNNPDYKAAAKRLEARLAADDGDQELALKLVKESASEESGIGAMMAAAEIYAAVGDRASAEKLWREVAVASNATTRAYAIAAANLADAELLRTAAARADDAGVRRFAGLRLGRVLVKSQKTFDEGAKTIRAIAKDAPDTAGAKDAALALADAFLDRGAWQEAADAFRDAMEIWPETAHVSAVQEGRGWALRKLGRGEEALDAFMRAEDAAKDDANKAMAILEQGDVLSDSGKGEEALAKYRIVLDKYPGTPAAGKLKEIVRRRELEAQGRQLYRDYRFAEAQQVFASIARSDPENSDRADFLQVLCLYGQGLDSEAEESAKRLAENAKDPKIRAEATLWLAKLAFNSSRWEESCALFFSFAEMDPHSTRSPGALLWAARAAFAQGDFNQTIRIVTHLVELYPTATEKAEAFAVQGEALVELGRYDEAILVLERALMDGGMGAAHRLKAEVLKADALFAMGADNPARYREALDAYRALRSGESLPPGLRLALSFKMGRVLEKLKRIDEAIDQYYTGVVLAYREGRQKGIAFDDEARAAFSRAAFRLADEFESRGKDFQAMHILELVIASDVPAANEAEKRLDRIQTKGRFP